MTPIWRGFKQLKINKNIPYLRARNGKKKKIGKEVVKKWQRNGKKKKNGWLRPVLWTELSDLISLVGFFVIRVKNVNVC